jgi:hypothetical protein
MCDFGKKGNMPLIVKQNGFFIKKLLHIVNLKIFEILIEHAPKKLSFYFFNPHTPVDLNFHHIDKEMDIGKLLL